MHQDERHACQVRHASYDPGEQADIDAALGIAREEVAQQEVPLRRLLIADPRSVIMAIRDEEVVSVTWEMDREEVARIVAKYDLVTIPVVDRQHRLVGTITVDDVLDIIGEEASEDIFRLAGSDAAELERRSPRQVALMRLPWVLLTLLIGTFFA